MTLKKTIATIDGAVEVDFTEAETTEYNAQIQADVDARTAKDAADAQEATDKANAKAKLIAGEALTEDEAKQIVGI